MTDVIPVGMIAAIAAIPTVYLAHRWRQGGQYTKKTKVDGKIVLITGGNTGIGKETAFDLACRGAKVYIACRDVKKGLSTKFVIVGKSGNKNVFVKQLDLTSFDSIRAFVEDFKKTESKLDILINNAGVLPSPVRETTKDGYELAFGTNHLGHFLLTNLLLDLLKAAAPSRIITVSSVTHKGTEINEDDLQMEKAYDPWKSYGRSKLANILFTRELSKRLEGTGITANSLHPGVVGTNILRSFSYLQFAMYWLNFTLKSAKSGAQTTIMLAVDSDLETVTGRYFCDCAIANESDEAKDDEKAKWLWKESERLTKLMDK